VTSTLLSELTTAAVGGPAHKFIKAGTEAEIIDAVRAADAAGEQLLIIAGGSNLLISDDPFAGVRIDKNAKLILGDAPGLGLTPLKTKPPRATRPAADDSNAY